MSATTSYSIEDIGGGMVTLAVVATCGHTQKLAYGGRQFAESDAGKQAAQPCLICRIKADAEEHEKSKRNG